MGAEAALGADTVLAVPTMHAGVASPAVLARPPAPREPTAPGEPSTRAAADAHAAGDEPDDGVTSVWKRRWAEGLLYFAQQVRDLEPLGREGGNQGSVLAAMRAAGRGRHTSLILHATQAGIEGGVRAALARYGVPGPVRTGQAPQQLDAAAAAVPCSLSPVSLDLLHEICDVATELLDKAEPDWSLHVQQHRQGAEGGAAAAAAALAAHSSGTAVVQALAGLLRSAIAADQRTCAPGAPQQQQALLLGALLHAMADASEQEDPEGLEDEDHGGPEGRSQRAVRALLQRLQSAARKRASLGAPGKNGSGGNGHPPGGALAAGASEAVDWRGVVALVETTMARLEGSPRRGPKLAAEGATAAPAVPVTTLTSTPGGAAPPEHERPGPPTSPGQPAAAAPPAAAHAGVAEGTTGAKEPEPLQVRARRAA